MGVSHWLGFSSRCLATDGVSMRMLQNLGILKL